ncbi:hypothetical protein L1987_15245 [Smallanthus sonchifolius]|uniref:Uncharacterized protein n=1 Tax=Smallanthus sonchifolius TaxID=185202 RepID=A0ACB9J540_9ASTR|nr:hypothetical protein L1987_15245 [Smallanthus sonchifolius]
MFQELAQLMPREISPRLILGRFVQGLAPQSSKGQEVERSENLRRVRKRRKQSEPRVPEEGEVEGAWKTRRGLGRRRKPYKGRFPLCSRCDYHHAGRCRPRVVLNVARLDTELRTARQINLSYQYAMNA